MPGRIAGRIGNARHLSGGVDRVTLTLRAAECAEVVQCGPVPQESVHFRIVGSEGIARHLPRIVDGSANAGRTPERAEIGQSISLLC